MGSGRRAAPLLIAGAVVILVACSTTAMPTTETSSLQSVPKTRSEGAPVKRPTLIHGFSERPASLTVGESLVDRVRVVPLVGQVMRVDVRSADDAWRTTTHTRVNSAGRAVVRVTPPGVGEYRLRLTTAGNSSLVAAATPFRTVTVSGEKAGRRVRYLYAVGDIGECGGQTPATARLIPSPGRVIAAGDLAYPSGSAASFGSCYLPYYGKFRDRTYPVPGNHEYKAPDLAYFDIFGPRVGTRAKPWYTVRFGKWRFMMLNSNCKAVGGCGVRSRQYRWLQSQVKAHPSKCLAAVWHAPRWSSGRHGSAAEMGRLYRRLVGAGADLVLSGHDHDYERFARLGAAGRLTKRGMRQFVVGTGGADRYQFRPPVAGSQVRSSKHHGVLRLRLADRGYSWRFLSTDGATVDHGSDTC